MSLDLKPILKARGLTQRQLATCLNVSDAAVSLYAAALREGLHERVPAERARPLADALGLPPSAIRPDLWPPSDQAA